MQKEGFAEPVLLLPATVVVVAVAVAVAVAFD